MRDPFALRVSPVERAKWSRAIRGQITELRDVAVARTLADYGNRDGTNCHPGIARLADDLCCSHRTVIRSLAELTRQGYLHLARRGSRKAGEADTYNLALPAPIADQFNTWDRDTHPATNGVAPNEYDDVWSRF
jgi:hypothetical protein